MASGLAVGGLALGGAGLLSSYSGQKKAAKQAKKIGKFQAAMLEQEAKFIEYDTQAALKKQKIQAKGLLGKQVSAMAGQGFSVASGTNRKLIQETIDLSDYDAMMIRWKGNVGIWKAKTQAQLARMGGSAAASAANARATGTLLSGGASLLGSLSGVIQNYGGGGYSTLGRGGYGWQPT